MAGQPHSILPRTAPMVRVPGGRFRMGSLDFYPEEQPVHEAEVSDLWVDEYPVTNAEFRRFVAATGWVTIAEMRPDPTDFPDGDPELIVAGSQVFTPTSGPVPLDDWRRWWRWCPGADWRHPEGPGSTLHGLERHPVVHAGWEDARAYAEWADKRLPTEAEWEHAARGGLSGATYPWGDDFQLGGKVRANTWQGGGFPFERVRTYDGVGTSRVKTFAPNGYGLYDVVGNVWEWTETRWAADHEPRPAPHTCCPTPAAETERRVTKGGSHLCSPTYCHRYRPAARQGHAIRSTTNHVGFRCVRDA